jgi:hypothetical protein
MMFAILGILLAALEAYAWLFRPNSYASINPITLALPIVIAAGVLKRPAKERVGILAFAAILAVSLNRALVAEPMLVRVLVFGGAAWLMWWGYRHNMNREAVKRFALAVVATVLGFLLLWLWQLR